MPAREMDPGIGGEVTLFHTSQLDKLINLARESSLWYLLFGLACCGIELIQTGGPRADLIRFGAIPRASPRQADFMIVAGTLTYKMAERAKLLYDQMSEPKYVISMGSCANCVGLFQLAYSVCKGVVDGFHLAGFGSALLGSILVGLTSWVASWYVGPKGKVEVLVVRG